MNMVVGDARIAGESLREVSPAEAREVRHFDQLSPGEQRAFLRLYRGERPTSTTLSTGEVIVFTDYYRVE